MEHGAAACALDKLRSALAQAPSPHQGEPLPA
jgi:hypothetical protein